MAGKADELNELDQANNVAADEAIVANEANFSDKASMQPCHNIIVICVIMLSPFSLTKYSVCVAEVKGYFGMNNNQLGGMFGGSEINNQLAGTFQNVTFSLRIWNLN